MTPQTILSIFLVLLAIELSWGSYLTMRNYRSVQRNKTAVPPPFNESISLEEHQKATRYSSSHLRLKVLRVLSGGIFTALIAASGLLGVLQNWVQGLGIGGYPAGMVFLALFGILSWLLHLPFSLYATFGIEKRFGFNTMTPKTWLLDLIKSTILGSSLGAAVLLALFAFMDYAGTWWWLWAASALTLFNLVMSFIYPVLIAPIFNKFKPLAEGSLKDQINSLCEKLGFRQSGVFVMDGSKRSAHSNAYFTGFGKFKRIVLYDTLIASNSEDELLAVLAHEIGHEKKRHVLLQEAFSIVMSFVLLFAVAQLKDLAALYQAFGIQQPGNAALFAILAIAMGPFTFFLNPLFALWSRKHERQADRFAAKAVSPQAMKSALITLSRKNASNLAPDPLYSFWYYSHPTLAERVRNIDMPDKREKVGDIR